MSGAVMLALWCAQIFGAAPALRLDLQHARLAPGPDGIVSVQSARPMGPGAVHVGVQSAYVTSPLVLRQGGTLAGDVVHDQVAIVPALAVGLPMGFSVGASWSVLPLQRTRAQYDGTRFQQMSGTHAGTGDLWLDGRLALVDQPLAGVDVAVGAAVRVPTSWGPWAGDGSVSLVPTVLLGRAWGPFAVAANVGAVVRKPFAVADLSIGPQGLWRLGGAYDLRAVQLPQGRLLAEASGLVGRQSPSQWLAGVGVQGETWGATLAGGGGIRGDYGAPRVRVMLTVSVLARASSELATPLWSLPPPSVADDPNSLSAPMGDPNALDPNGTDPNDPGPALDPNDPCARDPQDPNAAACPDVVDTDRDGLVDANDICPDDAEDQDGIDDRDGCPEDDADDDGIADAEDKCPMEPELINNFEDDDGCPDKGPPPLVKLEKTRIELAGKVFFGIGLATIMPRGHEVLDQLSHLLKNHKKLVVRLAGSTDSSGERSQNKALAENRAKAVRQYLIKRGIAAERLQLAPYNPHQPVRGTDPRSRALSRRVTVEVVGR